MSISIEEDLIASSPGWPRYRITLNADMLFIADYERSDYRGDYWEGTGREYENMADRSALMRLLPPRGHRLLEIGAGYGRLASLYTGYDQVILLDYSRSLLEEARARLGDERYVYVAADLYHLPLAAAVADTAVMVRVLHHLVDIPFALRQVAQVVRPEGCLVCEFANKRHLKNLARHVLGRAPGVSGPAPHEAGKLYYLHSPGWILEQLRAAGFRPEQRFSASFLRVALLKRWFSLSLLCALEQALRGPVAPFDLGPTVFVRARVAEPGANNLAATVFRCPTCGQVALDSMAEGLLCSGCRTLWPIVNGVHLLRRQDGQPCPPHSSEEEHEGLFHRTRGRTAARHRRRQPVPLL